MIQNPKTTLINPKITQINPKITQIKPKITQINPNMTDLAKQSQYSLRHSDYTVCKGITSTHSLSHKHTVHTFVHTYIQDTHHTHTHTHTHTYTHARARVNAATFLQLHPFLSENDGDADDVRCVLMMKNGGDDSVHTTTIVSSMIVVISISIMCLISEPVTCRFGERAGRWTGLSSGLHVQRS